MAASDTNRKTPLEDLSTLSKPSLKHHLTTSKSFFQTSSTILKESVLLSNLNNKIKSFNKAVLYEQTYSLKLANMKINRKNIILTTTSSTIEY